MNVVPFLWVRGSCAAAVSAASMYVEMAGKTVFPLDWIDAGSWVT